MKRIRVFKTPEGKNIAKQMDDEQVAKFLADNPNHTLVR